VKEKLRVRDISRPVEKLVEIDREELMKLPIPMTSKTAPRFLSSSPANKKRDMRAPWTEYQLLVCPSPEVKRKRTDWLKNF
jgi:hypothetical protein